MIGFTTLTCFEKGPGRRKHFRRSSEYCLVGPHEDVEKENRRQLAPLSYGSLPFFKHNHIKPILSKRNENT